MTPHTQGTSILTLSPLIQHSGTANSVAHQSQLYVVNNIKYERDVVQFNRKEKYLKASETLRTRKGDCEDGAILMAAIMRKNGIPADRVRVVAGDVTGAGHAYCIFLADRADGSQQWEIHDWCYYPDPKTTTGKKTVWQEKGVGQYKKPWFWFNDKEFHSYNNMQHNPQSVDGSGAEDNYPLTLTPNGWKYRK